MSKSKFREGKIMEIPQFIKQMFRRFLESRGDKVSDEEIDRWFDEFMGTEKPRGFLDGLIDEVVDRHQAESHEGGTPVIVVVPPASAPKLSDNQVRTIVLKALHSEPVQYELRQLVNRMVLEALGANQASRSESAATTEPPAESDAY
jgi:hypothetical protein